MTWALESSPPATVTLRDTWSGRPQRISRPRTASKVRQQDCVSTSHAGWRFCFHLYYCHPSDTPGVDIWIENVQGECLRIRERRQVKVGHVAIGISDQVRERRLVLNVRMLSGIQWVSVFSLFVFFSIYFDLNGSFKERTLSWNKKYETCHRSRIEKWNLIHETFESKWFAHRITLQSDPSSFAKYALFPHRNM